MKKNDEDCKPRKRGRPKKIHPSSPPKKFKVEPRKRGRPRRVARPVAFDEEAHIYPSSPPRFSSVSNGSSKKRHPCAEIVRVDTAPNDTTDFEDTKPIIEKAHSLTFPEIADIMNRNSNDNNIDDDDNDVVVVRPVIINVKGYSVKLENVSLVKKIIKKHGDIGRNCKIKCGKTRGLFIEMMCSVYKNLKENSLKEITETEVEGMLETVNVLESKNFDMKWLSERLKEISGIRKLFKEHSSMKNEDPQKTEEIVKKEKEIKDYKYKVMEYEDKLLMAEDELFVLKDELNEENRVNTSLMEKGCVFWKSSLVHGLV